MKEMTLLSGAENTSVIHRVNDTKEEMTFSCNRKECFWLTASLLLSVACALAIKPPVGWLVGGNRAVFLTGAHCDRKG